MTIIQIRNVGHMWHILQNGTVCAFASTYRGAQHRAAQLQGSAL